MMPGILAVSARSLEQIWLSAFDRLREKGHLTLADANEIAELRYKGQAYVECPQAAEDLRARIREVVGHASEAIRQLGEQRRVEPATLGCLLEADSSWMAACIRNRIRELLGEGRPAAGEPTANLSIASSDTLLELAINRVKAKLPPEIAEGAASHMHGSLNMLEALEDYSYRLGAQTACLARQVAAQQANRVMHNALATAKHCGMPKPEPNQRGYILRGSPSADTFVAYFAGDRRTLRLLAEMASVPGANPGTVIERVYGPRAETKNLYLEAAKRVLEALTEVIATHGLPPPDGQSRGALMHYISSKLQDHVESARFDDPETGQRLIANLRSAMASFTAAGGRIEDEALPDLLAHTAGKELAATMAELPPGASEMAVEALRAGTTGHLKLARVWLPNLHRRVVNDYDRYCERRQPADLEYLSPGG